MAVEAMNWAVWHLQTSVLKNNYPSNLLEKMQIDRNVEG
jgi:hypothetical protein